MVTPETLTAPPKNAGADHIKEFKGHRRTPTPLLPDLNNSTATHGRPTRHVPPGAAAT